MSDNIFKIKTGRKCQHNRIEIDEEFRSVVCQDCGAVLDPFDYLYKCAIRESWAIHNLQRLEQEVKDLEKKRDKLRIVKR